MVADAEKEKGDNDDEDNGPEVDELGGKDGCVAVSQDSEVVALDVAEGENDVLPAPCPEEAQVSLEAVAVDGVGGVDEVQEDVVEEALKGGDRGALVVEESGEGVGSC